MGRAGRPPIGERAMTPAEKMRRYRERKFGNKPKRPPVTKFDQTPTAEIIAQAPQASDETTGLQAENAALQDEVIRLKTVLQSWTSVVQSRESGIMRLVNFKLIRSCLHPDSRKSTSGEKLAKAFRIFNRLEYVLCDEAELPTKEPAFTAKEWAWMRGRKKRQALAAKNAKRRAQSGSSSHPPKPLPQN